MSAQFQTNPGWAEIGRTGHCNRGANQFVEMLIARQKTKPTLDVFGNG